jgi:hypothetical protein
MSYDKLSRVSQQLTGEERRVPFIFGVCRINDVIDI